MQPTLEDQERHLLVKVIDRILYKLDELVRPYVHKILVSWAQGSYVQKLLVCWRGGGRGGGCASRMCVCV